MMKKTYFAKTFTVFLALCVMLSVFAGCNNKEEPIAVAIVIGNHANSNNFTEDTYNAVHKLVRKAVYEGYVAVIRADGKPEKLTILNSDGTPAKFIADAKTGFYRELLIEEYTNVVMNFLKSDDTRAIHPEVDLLSAVKIANSALSYSDLREKHIVILDNGISTAGRINLTKFCVDTGDIPQLVNALKETKGILPDLSGINIHFLGIGNVCDPQELPDTSQPNVIKLWKEVFLACGIEESKIYIDEHTIKGSKPNRYSEDEGGYPYVTVVNFKSVEIEITQEKSSELLLPDVGFYPNSDEMIDENNAKNILEPYANAMIKYFNKNGDAKLYLLGTTATTTPGGNGDVLLSQKRAKKLKNVLSSLGVPEDKLIAIGVGANVPSHLRINEFRDGKFDGGLAQGNRKVTVYMKENKDFQEIIAFNGLDISKLD